MRIIAYTANPRAYKIIFAIYKVCALPRIIGDVACEMFEFIAVIREAKHSGEHMRIVYAIFCFQAHIINVIVSLASITNDEISCLVCCNTAYVIGGLNATWQCGGKAWVTLALCVSRTKLEP